MKTIVKQLREGRTGVSNMSKLGIPTNGIAEVIFFLKEASLSD